MKKLNSVKELNDVVASSEKRVVVNVSAPWCGPCKMIQPQLEKLDTDEDRIELYKVSADEDTKIPQEYGVSGIPAFIIFEKGEKIDQFSGAQNLGQITKGL